MTQTSLPCRSCCLEKARERVWSGDTRSGALFLRLVLTPEHDEGSDREEEEEEEEEGSSRVYYGSAGSTAAVCRFLDASSSPDYRVGLRLPRRLFMAD